MMLLFKSTYRPTNYKHEEIVCVLENRDKISYIIAHWDTKSVNELAKEFNVNSGTILRWVKGKAKKKKRICKNPKPPITNLVLNTETGIYYNSFSSAGKSIGMCRQTMRDHIRGVGNVTGFEHWKIV